MVLFHEVTKETSDDTLAFGGGAFDEIQEEVQKGVEKVTWCAPSPAMQWRCLGSCELAWTCWFITIGRVVIDYGFVGPILDLALEVRRHHVNHGLLRVEVCLEEHGRFVAKLATTPSNRLHIARCFAGRLHNRSTCTPSWCCCCIPLGAAGKGSTLSTAPCPVGVETCTSEGEGFLREDHFAH